MYYQAYISINSSWTENGTLITLELTFDVRQLKVDIAGGLYTGGMIPVCQPLPTSKGWSTMCTCVTHATGEDMSLRWSVGRAFILFTFCLGLLLCMQDGGYAT